MTDRYMLSPTVAYLCYPTRTYPNSYPPHPQPSPARLEFPISANGFPISANELQLAIPAIPYLLLPSPAIPNRPNDRQDRLLPPTSELVMTGLPNEGLL